MFVGRDRELKSLEGLYKSGRFEFVVLYGRRRVGKTALINKFTEGKPAVYFTGVESSAVQNLENFSRAVLEYKNDLPAETSFVSFQAALEYVFKLSEKKRLILAVDEYPYVARASKSFASTLQLLIDKYKDKSKLMLILCGSSMSYMEDHVLAYKAPLYGRRTAQIKLLPFSFKESCEYFKSFKDEDKAVAYGVVGGTPQYLLQINGGQSIEDNIKRIYLDPSSYLFEEPLNLLKQEVREPSVYAAVVTSVASGASRLSEISGKIGENTNVCSVYVKNLIALGIIRKETPFGEKASKKALYSIEDNMFRFWYRFIPENASMIARGAAETVYRRIEPRLPDMMGKVFEDICRQYLWELLLRGKCPVSFTDLGRWWGADPAAHSQAEIDIIGAQDKNTALFAECKWTNEKVDLGVLETLISRSRLLPYKNAYYYLFSKSGFTKGCRDKAAALGRVSLVTFADVMKEMKKRDA